MTIQVSYIAKWHIKNNENYKFTICKKLINCKIGKEVLKTTFGNGKEFGYYINGKFIKYSELKKMIELIPKNTYCPF
jgi:hypothetical protein